MGTQYTHKGYWRYWIEGVTQPSICYKVRIPSGVFGIASPALYASAPNHVIGQMLGLPGSWVCRLTFRYYRLRQAKGELLRLCLGYSG